MSKKIIKPNKRITSEKPRKENTLKEDILLIPANFPLSPLPGVENDESKYRNN